MIRCPGGAVRGGAVAGMRRPRSLLALVLAALTACSPVSPRSLASGAAAASRPLAIVGGTLVDLADSGNSNRDVRDSVVVIEGERIVAAGPRSEVRVPREARILDARGGYVVPGLIDGFASQANQAFANAYLYMGVTSVVTSLPLQPGEERRRDVRRGSTFATADPSPRLFFLASLPGGVLEGETVRPMTEAEAREGVERLAAAGTKVLLLHYWFRPAPLRAAAARARELGLATIGELGHTTYYEAQEAGVDAFVHTSRYSLDLTPPDLHERVARAPFGPPRREFYKYLGSLTPQDLAVARHAERLAGGPSLLIPTLSLFYLEMPDHENLWKEPVARILSPADIHLAADPETGQPPVPPEQIRDAVPSDSWRAMLMLEEQYRKSGARYLAGSGTSAFGTMPGISLHTELALLVRIGLTPRQALAAATANYNALAPWRQLGRIAPGYEADLVILDADPTVDSGNVKRIRSVLLRGREIDREGLLAVGPE
jgi:amidohydrolase family protein